MINIKINNKNDLSNFLKNTTPYNIEKILKGYSNLFPLMEFENTKSDLNTLMKMYEEKYDCYQFNNINHNKHLNKIIDELVLHIESKIDIQSLKEIIYNLGDYKLLKLSVIRLFADIILYIEGFDYSTYKLINDINNNKLVNFISNISTLPSNNNDVSNDNLIISVYNNDDEEKKYNSCNVKFRLFEKDTNHAFEYYINFTNHLFDQAFAMEDKNIIIRYIIHKAIFGLCKNSLINYMLLYWHITYADNDNRKFSVELSNIINNLKCTDLFNSIENLSISNSYVSNSKGILENNTGFIILYKDKLLSKKQYMIIKNAANDLLDNLLINENEIQTDTSFLYFELNEIALSPMKLLSNMLINKYEDIVNPNNTMSINDINSICNAFIQIFNVFNISDIITLINKPLDIISHRVVWNQALNKIGSKVLQSVALCYYDNDKFNNTLLINDFKTFERIMTCCDNFVYNNYLESLIIIFKIIFQYIKDNDLEKYREGSEWFEYIKDKLLQYDDVDFMQENSTQYIIMNTMQIVYSPELSIRICVCLNSVLPNTQFKIDLLANSFLEDLNFSHIKNMELNDNNVMNLLLQSRALITYTKAVINLKLTNMFMSVLHKYLMNSKIIDNHNKLDKLNVYKYITSLKRNTLRIFDIENNKYIYKNVLIISDNQTISPNSINFITNYLNIYNSKAKSIISKCNELLKGCDE